MWNGRDPILKERPFGLTGAEANHGEDVKEYWWYLDALPSHAWNRWRYHYPQAAFPYEDLRQENGRRGKLDPEYELLDTGAFDEDRYWIVEVHYAKADPPDLLMSVQVTNAGPDAETLHVLPTAWFRNTWSWDVDAPKPELAANGAGRRSGSATRSSASWSCWAARARAGRTPTLLFCDNETNDGRLYGVSSSPPYPKDGINDHVVAGAATVNPERRGHQVRVLVPADGGARGHRRAAPAPAPARDASPAADCSARRELRRGHGRPAGARPTSSTPSSTPKAASADEALVMRQAFAGMLWSKQLYYYDVARWLDGDPTQPRHRRLAR